MIPVFGDENKRQINLGGASTAAAERNVLRNARREREERRQVRHRQESADKLQAWWRGIRESRRIHRELKRTFEADPTSLTGLRCLVLIGHDEEVLKSWSCAMNKGKSITNLFQITLTSRRFSLQCTAWKRG